MRRDGNGGPVPLPAENGTARGTYVLILHLETVTSIEVGRLGCFDFAPGYYAYVGSACGPGGLAGRLRHHLALTLRRGVHAAPRRHWHIDYLRDAAEVVEVWLGAGAAGREHAWAALLQQLAGATLPVARFGASDCTCPAHLFHFPAMPSLEAFRCGLRGRFPADPPVERWTLSR